MPSLGTGYRPEYYHELRRLKSEYEQKLIAKGIHPKSLKMMELMHRKFR